MALHVGLLKHLGDVATVLLDLVCLSFQTDWMMMRSDLCVEHCLTDPIATVMLKCTMMSGAICFIALANNLGLRNFTQLIVKAN